ncbi:MAG TPA: hypothetical protein VMA71_06275 [Alloacidobacterium sp.]|nr:hypothetical protein [Alloacidobacterium sp.]
MNRHQDTSNHADNRIDATLRLLAHAQPPAEFEQRIYVRLHDESARTQKSLAGRFGRFFLAQRIVFASAAAALACCAIVIGSVQHSRQRAFPATGVHLSAPGSGLGAASGTRIAPAPIAAPEHARARAERKATGGRATVSRDAHKPKGVAVPESTEPEKP